MSDASIHVVLIDNHDSFVYNLVDAFAVGGYRCTVFRNTVPVTEILAVEPDIICLSPGPGHPLDAGTMMQLIDATLGQIPILGICLGFQALLAHYGATVQPCGPADGMAIGLQFHPESILSPNGPIILDRCIETLISTTTPK